MDKSKVQNSPKRLKLDFSNLNGDDVESETKKSVSRQILLRSKIFLQHRGFTKMSRII